MAIYYRSRYSHNDGTTDKDAWVRFKRQNRISVGFCSSYIFGLYLAEIAKVYPEIKRDDLVRILESDVYRVNRYTIDMYLDTVFKNRTTIGIDELRR